MLGDGQHDPVNYQRDMNMDYPLYSPSQTENTVMKWKGLDWCAVSAVISAVIPPAAHRSV